ncbi:hypothetical protein B0H15DRAFT_927485 [Mycena belliarum]|uniref:RRM domain-containing protein n=1 Tax=Mycena belliarum TaxID=1033014 RepID=A0AAD6UFV1_9AGAR|nr:hypothetical protein B0H15DRAFT_927485 [Mycena belliae]
MTGRPATPSSSQDAETTNGLPAEEFDKGGSLIYPRAAESFDSSALTHHLTRASLSPCSPSPCDTSKLSVEGGDLISFSSGNLAVYSSQREPVSAPPSPPLPPAVQPKSPKLASDKEEDTSPSPVDSDDAIGRKTPNVYINGLPAHFREDQLLSITAQFGNVLSVRCFTRFTTRTPSGYGFVLFDSIAAAEKCIVTLKRSELHPSFSKVNKPPRVVCSPHSPSLPAGSSMSSLASISSVSSEPDGPSFKDRMAQLEDKRSSNLYLEGLPMSADKSTLAALVHPHTIHSSRFLRSKVPGSRTMIAFMRMETRAAAEDVIVRLDGRKVRGWDGEEGRVGVRVADNLEQRELRRAEAAEAAAGDESGGRMSIAQATLLNYQGSRLGVQAQVPCMQTPTRPEEGAFQLPPAALPMHIPTQLPLLHPQLPLLHPNHPLPHPLAGQVHALMAQAARPSPTHPMMQQPALPPHFHPRLHALPAHAHPLQDLFFNASHPRVDPLYAPYTSAPPLPPLPMNMNLPMNMQANMQMNTPPRPMNPEIAALFAAMPLGNANMAQQHASQHGVQFKAENILRNIPQSTPPHNMQKPAQLHNASQFTPPHTNPDSTRPPLHKAPNLAALQNAKAQAHTKTTPGGAKPMKPMVPRPPANALKPLVPMCEGDSASGMQIKAQGAPRTVPVMTPFVNPLHTANSGAPVRLGGGGAQASGSPNHFSANANTNPIASANLNAGPHMQSAGPDVNVARALAEHMVLQAHAQAQAQFGTPSAYGHVPFNTSQGPTPVVHLPRPFVPTHPQRQPPQPAQYLQPTVRPDMPRTQTFPQYAPETPPHFQHNMDPSNTRAHPQQPHSFGTHTRAATAPPVHASADVPAWRRRTRTNTNTNAGGKANANANTNMHTNQNLPPFGIPKPGDATSMDAKAKTNVNTNGQLPRGASMRVFLGPANANPKRR